MIKYVAQPRANSTRGKLYAIEKKTFEIEPLLKFHFIFFFDRLTCDRSMGLQFDVVYFEYSIIIATCWWYAITNDWKYRSYASMFKKPNIIGYKFCCGATEKNIQLNWSPFSSTHLQLPGKVIMWSVLVVLPGSLPTLGQVKYEYARSTLNICAQRRTYQMWYLNKLECLLCFWILVNKIRYTWHVRYYTVAFCPIFSRASDYHSYKNC